MESYIRESKKLTFKGSKGKKLLRYVDICLNNKALHDSHIVELVKILKKYIKVVYNNYYCLNIDLSENYITCTGLKTLLKFILSYSENVGVHILKLYKNNIKDDGVSLIKQLVYVQKIPMEELHLSHNFVQDNTCKELLLSFVQAKKENNYVYPRYEKYQNSYKHLQIPVWIRLEYNCIQNPKEILKEVEEFAKKKRGYKSNLIICAALKSDKRCCPYKCLNATARNTPIMHVYMFIHQKDNPSQAISANGKVIKEEKKRELSTPSEVTDAGKHSSGNVEQKGGANEEEEDQEVGLPSKGDANGEMQSGGTKSTVKGLSKGVSKSAAKGGLAKAGDTVAGSTENTAKSKGRNDKTSVVRKRSGNSGKRHIKGSLLHDVSADEEDDDDNYDEETEEELDDEVEEEEEDDEDGDDSSEEETESDDDDTDHDSDDDDYDYARKKVLKTGAKKGQKGKEKNGQLSDAAVLYAKKNGTIAGMQKDGRDEEDDDNDDEGEDESSNVTDPTPKKEEKKKKKKKKKKKEKTAVSPLEGGHEQQKENDNDNGGGDVDDDDDTFRMKRGQLGSMGDPLGLNNCGEEDDMTPEFTPQQNDHMNFMNDTVSSLPLYIILDCTAVLDMKELWKDNSFLPFSFPGLLYLYNNKLLRSNADRAKGVNNGATSSEDMQNDAFICLMCSYVANELKLVCQKSEIIRQKMVNLKLNIWDKLSELGVIEFLSVPKDFKEKKKNFLNSSFLTEAQIKLANEYYDISQETLQMIQFSILWSTYIYKIGNREIIIKNDAKEINKGDVKKSRKTIFTEVLYLTSSPNIYSFFEYLYGEDMNMILPLCVTVNQINKYIHDEYSYVVELLSSGRAVEDKSGKFLLDKAFFKTFIRDKYARYLPEGEDIATGTTGGKTKKKKGATPNRANRNDKLSPGGKRSDNECIKTNVGIGGDPLNSNAYDYYDITSVKSFSNENISKLCQLEGQLEGQLDGSIQGGPLGVVGINGANKGVKSNMGGRTSGEDTPKGGAEKGNTVAAMYASGMDPNSVANNLGMMMMTQAGDSEKDNPTMGTPQGGKENKRSLYSMLVNAFNGKKKGAQKGAEGINGTDKTGSNIFTGAGTSQSQTVRDNVDLLNSHSHASVSADSQEVHVEGRRRENNQNDGNSTNNAATRTQQNMHNSKGKNTSTDLIDQLMHGGSATAAVTNGSVAGQQVNIPADGKAAYINSNNNSGSSVPPAHSTIRGNSGNAVGAGLGGVNFPINAAEMGTLPNITTQGNAKESERNAVEKRIGSDLLNVNDVELNNFIGSVPKSFNDSLSMYLDSSNRNDNCYDSIMRGENMTPFFNQNLLKEEAAHIRTEEHTKLNEIKNVFDLYKVDILNTSLLLEEMILNENVCKYIPSELYNKILRCYERLDCLLAGLNRVGNVSAMGGISPMDGMGGMSGMNQDILSEDFKSYWDYAFSKNESNPLSVSAKDLMTSSGAKVNLNGGAPPVQEDFIDGGRNINGNKNGNVSSTMFYNTMNGNRGSSSAMKSSMLNASSHSANAGMGGGSGPILASHLNGQNNGAVTQKKSRKKPSMNMNMSMGNGNNVDLGISSIKNNSVQKKYVSGLSDGLDNTSFMNNSPGGNVSGSRNTHMGGNANYNLGQGMPPNRNSSGNQVGARNNGTGSNNAKSKDMKNYNAIPKERNLKSIDMDDYKNVNKMLALGGNAQNVKMNGERSPYDHHVGGSGGNTDTEHREHFPHKINPYNDGSGNGACDSNLLALINMKKNMKNGVNSNVGQKTGTNNGPGNELNGLRNSSYKKMLNNETIGLLNNPGSKNAVNEMNLKYLEVLNSQFNFSSRENRKNDCDPNALNSSMMNFQNDMDKKYKNPLVDLCDKGNVKKL